MSDFKEMLSTMAFGMTKSEAHSKDICVSCKQPPVFYTELGRKEYRISGMCEKCWDELFKEEG